MTLLLLPWVLHKWQGPTRNLVIYTFAPQGSDDTVEAQVRRSPLASLLPACCGYQAYRPYCSKQELGPEPDGEPSALGFLGRSASDVLHPLRPTCCRGMISA